MIWLPTLQQLILLHEKTVARSGGFLMPIASNENREKSVLWEKREKRENREMRILKKVKT